MSTAALVIECARAVLYVGVATFVWCYIVRFCAEAYLDLMEWVANR